MQHAGTLLTRDDTFFGVCQGLGEDLGFSPQYLRAAFAVALFIDPLTVIAGYAALGLVVALARWAYPVASGAEDASEAAATPGGEAQDQSVAEDTAEAEPVPLAA